MIGENRYYPDNKKARTRSNTGDGYQMVAEMLRGSSSSGPQKLLAVAAFAPYGFDIETVGYTREHVGLPEWPAGDVHYIQETLSFLEQTRAARDSLQEYSQSQ